MQAKKENIDLYIQFIHLLNRPAYAEPVFRSGEKVNIQEVEAEDKTEKISSWVNEMKAQGNILIIKDWNF